MSEKNTLAADTNPTVNMTDAVEAATWTAKSVEMEQRYKATERKHDMKRCAQGAYRKMNSEQIQKIHTEAKSQGWPNTVISLCKFGCADNQVATIFKEHGLAPLNVRKSVEKSVEEQIEEQETIVASAEAKIKELIATYHEELKAEEEALAKKKERIARYHA